MTQIVPSPLQRGNKVGIVAPAGKIDREKIQPALDTIASWGVEVVTGRNVYGSHGYFSGTDMERLSDLQHMLDNPEIKAIFCLRGGYGLTRIIDYVQFDELLKNPKWIIGFSDITVLHSKISNNQIESVHGIMPSLFIPEEAYDSINHLKDFLFGNVKEIEWDSHPRNLEGKASGFLRGGNLSILSDSIGTSTALNTESTILFLEEVDEYLYKLDRMLVHLERAHWFFNINALLIGHFTAIKDTKTPFGKDFEEIVIEKVGHLGIPVAFGLPCGHDYPNLALPHNRFVHLEVNADKSILTL